MKTKLLIFGITGDLSTRKLLPALNKIVGVPNSDPIEIIGVSRRDVDVHELLQQSIGDNVLTRQTTVFTMDLAEVSEYHRLRKAIALTSDEQLLVYLSVPPQSAAQIVDFLGEANINSSNVKILFEKPFGVDLTSAEEVIARTSRYFKEEQIYRIDHYLAKEMAQNIVALRGGNALFSHVWNNSAIESVELLALESLTIEGRAQFYEQAGALRDVIQGHLMQLLALILMDIPAEYNWDQLPAARLAALTQLIPADPKNVVRAQYDGYRTEANNAKSMVETFVSMQLTSEDPRWKNVPLTLTTGKAMDQKTTEIRVNFRKFHDTQRNRLILRIQPNEGVEIELFTKKPGYEREFETRKLTFNYDEDALLPDAYEQVIVDAIKSRKSLFTSGEEVLASWRVLQPIQRAWEMDDTTLGIYAVRSSVDDVLKKR
ncbi:MAG TPA: glucose-6-phosphate dehydrogenase [Candidatus Saccharimonadales bacterium]|nr:glucose-6-phosphate dehydrogenase [Candidatus Saccharimonadales bacterium]